MPCADGLGAPQLAAAAALTLLFTLSTRGGPRKRANVASFVAVLMVAITLTEMNQLKNLVSEVDPNAFVIVSPAKEVLGRGFSPLRDNRK